MKICHCVNEIDVCRDMWQTLQESTKPIVMYGMGNGADKILAVFTMATLTLAIFPVFCDVFSLITEFNQGVFSLIHYEFNVSTVAAVSPIGSTVGYVFFTAKRDGTVTAFSCFDINIGFINKYGHNNLAKMKQKGYAVRILKTYP